MKNETKVVLLGTGTPNADPERKGPSLAVVAGDQAYIVDFGPGIVRQAAAAFEAGIEALSVRNLNTAFLTHLHSDHTIGYPDLIFSPWVLGRSQPLQVYGPPGLNKMTEHILTAYEMDRDMRVCGFEPINKDAYGAVSHEIQPGVCFEDDHIRVTAFKVDHGENWLAVGYQFETEDRRIVISGDTAPMEETIAMWQGCDLLVHEVYSSAGFAGRPPNWQQYHSHMHTSTIELGKIASRVQPGKLVLTHQLFWGRTPQDLIDEIRTEYDGEVVSGVDLGVY